MIETLRNNAFELAAYAWKYRDKYEEDVIKGKIYRGKVSIHYELHPPADWLTYLTSIAFAAILGGLSYDVFKIILTKIAKSFYKKFKRKIPKERWQQNFYDKLKEYFIGKRNPDSPIFKAHVHALLRGAELIAEAKSSPKFEENIVKLLNLTKNLNKDKTIEIPESILETKPPKEELIKKQIKESIKRIRKEERRVKQLRGYIRKTMTIKESDK